MKNFRARSLLLSNSSCRVRRQIHLGLRDRQCADNPVTVVARRWNSGLASLQQSRGA